MSDWRDFVHTALVGDHPTEAEARAGFVDAGVPYLGVWRLPEPYGGVVHVFSDEMTAEQLTAAEWTQEDAWTEQELTAAKARAHDEAQAFQELCE